MKVVDFHCDTLSELRRAQKEGRNTDIRKNDLHIDLEKLRKGDYLLQCFAAYINLGEKEIPLISALEQIDIFLRIMEENSGVIAPVRTWADLEKNRREGKISGMLTIEDGGCCLGNPAVLRILYELGVRIMSLTWNFENELAYPNFVPGNSADDFPCGANETHGLKECGIEFVGEMERLGIVVDVSHLSDAGFWDVYRCSKRPFIATHSNARALCGHVRNLTDDMIRAISEKGGLTGINYCAAFLDSNPEAEQQRSTVALMAEHIRHIRETGGIDMIALGSDFDGIGNNLEMYDCSCLPMLETELRRRHFSDDEIEKIFYGNALRLLKEFLPAG